MGLAAVTGQHARPQNTDEFGWKPTMTPEEADAWLLARGSKMRGPLFHGTSPWRAHGILRDGFRVGRGKDVVNSQRAGEGVYLTNSHDLAARKYAGDQAEGLLETRVAVEHPASLSESLDILKTVRGRGLSDREFPAAVRALAEQRGFDALQVEFYDPAAGEQASARNWIVFDPHKIVVVKRKEAA